MPAWQSDPNSLQQANWECNVQASLNTYVLSVFNEIKSIFRMSLEICRRYLPRPTHEI